MKQKKISAFIESLDNEAKSDEMQSYLLPTSFGGAGNDGISLLSTNEAGCENELNCALSDNEYKCVNSHKSCMSSTNHQLCTNTGTGDGPAENYQDGCKK